MRIERLRPTSGEAVRVARFLLETFAKEHKFGSQATTSIHTDRAWAHVHGIVEKGAVWLAIGGDGEIAGSLSLSVDELWWTDREFLRDGWFYVRPEKRGTTAACCLLDEAEKYAKELRLPLVVNVFHSGDPERAAKFLTRMGFTALGGTFIQEN